MKCSIKRHIISSFACGLILVSLPGCWWRKKQQVECTPAQSPAEAVNFQMAGGSNIPLGSGSTSLVDAFDQTESFVLDDETPHTMAQNNSSVTRSDVHPETLVLHFDYDSNTIRTDQRPVLEKIKQQTAEWAKEGRTVVFKGHSCEWGANAKGPYGVALSNNRAYSVAQLCELPGAKTKVFGVGCEEPNVFECSKEGQAPNRRVEVYPLS